MLKRLWETKKTAVMVIMAVAFVTATVLGITAYRKNPSDNNKNNDVVTVDVNTIEGINQYFKGKKIAFTTGNTFDILAPQWFPESEFVQFNAASDMIKALLDNKITAFLVDKPIAKEIERTVPEVRMSEVILMPDVYGVVFGKNNTALRDKFNTAMAQMKADGIFDKMLDKWLNATDRSITDLKLTGENGTLQIATTATEAPFTYSENGIVTGYDFDILTYFCNMYGYNYEVQIMDFAAMIPAVSSGKCDIAIANISITDERKKQVSFSDPYYEAGSVAMLRADVFKDSDRASIDDYDVAGKKIGVGVGTFAMTASEKYFKNATLEYYNNESDGFLAVQSGILDGYACGAELIDYAIGNLDGIKAIRDDVMGGCEIAAGLSKKSPKLKKQIDEAITAFTNDGTLEDMYTRWLVNHETDMPQITPAENPQGTLRVGTCAVVEPFSFKKGETLTGFEIELAKRVAAHIGMDVIFELYDFSSIVAALQSGKIDAAFTDLNVTEERKHVIDYSVPYLHSSTYLLVKDKNASRKITSLSRLQNWINGKTIAVKADSVQESFSKEKFPNSKLVYYENQADIFAALEEGKADMFIDDLTTFESYKSTNPSTKIKFLADISLKRFEIGYVFKLGNTKLCEQMNEFLRKNKANGVIGRLEKKWNDSDNFAPISSNFKLTGENGTLTVATSSTNQPYEFSVDGEFTGLEIEILYMFCEKHGYNLKFSNVDSAELITAVQSGKADIGAHSLFKTAERSKQVLFSECVLGKDIYAGINQTAFRDHEDRFALTIESIKASFERTFITENRWKLILQGLLTTLIISIFSAIFGTILGFGICMARRSKYWLLSIPARIMIKITQGTPIVVILMILYYIIFGDINSVFVAIIGFSINFAVYVSEMMRTGIDAVDGGQIEAAAAIGFTRIQTFIIVVLPQAAKYFLPVFKGEFISMLKTTSVVGYIAIQDLTKMSDIIRSRTYEAFFPLIATAIIYFLLSWLLTSIISVIEVKIDPKHRKRLVKGVNEHD